MINYLKKWNIMRILRLTIGVIIVVQGFISKEWLLMGLGIFFSILPIVNVGSCSTSSACSVPAHRRKT